MGDKVPVVESKEFIFGDNDEGYHVAANHFLLKPSGNQGGYCALELHVHEDYLSMKEENNEDKLYFRVFIHTGKISELQNQLNVTANKIGEKRIYHLKTIGTAEALYESILSRYQSKLSYRQFRGIFPKIGSGLLTSNNSMSSSSILQSSVQLLVKLVGNFKFLILCC